MVLPQQVTWAQTYSFSQRRTQEACPSELGRCSQRCLHTPTSTWICGMASRPNLILQSICSRSNNKRKTASSVLMLMCRNVCMYVIYMAKERAGGWWVSGDLGWFFFPVFLNFCSPQFFIIGKITYLVLSKMTYFPLFCAFTLNARGFDAFFHFFLTNCLEWALGY